MKTNIGSLLLDQNDRYVIDDTLPNRPSNDKAWLKLLIENLNVPTKNLRYLPKSLHPSSKDMQGFLGIRIRDIATADILLIHRTHDTREGGKKFRLDNYEKLEKVEIWVRKNS